VNHAASVDCLDTMIGMMDVTTIKVSVETRDGLREVARHYELTLDAALRRLIRTDRQRRMGEELAAHELTDDERAWIELGITDARR
jgi:hypothetical protein